MSWFKKIFGSPYKEISENEFIGYIVDPNIESRMMLHEEVESLNHKFAIDKTTQVDVYWNDQVMLQKRYHSSGRIKYLKRNR